LALDGSPQGKTAYLTKPYLTPVPGCESDCRGFSNLTQQQVNNLFVLCYQNNVQLYAHCNGDAAIDMMIKGHELATTTLKDTVSDRRTVIIHSQIMREKSAIRKGIHPTNHTDCTVTPMDQLFLLWSSVNRLSRSGRVMGEAQRVTPYEGLQALTIHGAYQYFEEATKGSLKEGKLADFVLLDKNPLKEDPGQIKEIVVLETIKEGKTIFKR
jgi:predicted amidohydrolase YtcJ